MNELRDFEPTAAGFRIPFATVLLEGSVRERVACPTCGRQSGLSAVDGGDCLACTMRRNAARILGEGLWSAVTDNTGIGWKGGADDPLGGWA